MSTESLTWVSGPDDDLPEGFDGALTPNYKQAWRMRRSRVTYFKGTVDPGRFIAMRDFMEVPFGDLTPRTQDYLLGRTTRK